MTKSVVVEGEAPETDDELPVIAPRTKLKKSNVVEGEAPETDEECDDFTPAPSKNVTVPEVIKIPEKARVHVDEKLVQRWRTLASDSLMHSVRRLQPTMKAVDDMERCLDNTMASVQSTSALVRHTARVVYRLEDSINAILEASRLIPENFENTVEVMKIL
ncbi:unnamed protein product [Cylicocyclus nassatus]|uniref:Biogenesis of lysosome-related organelles complex 1 subunit 3 n=1 Tax=Cylicocyclus nassatus TaxID=53992 RepID=A0AA36GJZ7_CYLNA|nr:unnamed protein product [Cylicocyclus nassatus]